MGLATALWQAHRAESQRLIAQRRFDQGRQLAHSIIHEIQPKLAAINGTVALRKMAIERTLSYLEALASEASDSPPLMRELLDSYVELAKVAVDPGTSNVGDAHTAAGILQKGDALATVLARLDGATPASERSLIHFYNAVARNAAYYGSLPAAESHARQALAIAERLAASTPGDLPAQNELASSAMTLADVTTDVPGNSDVRHNTRAELYQRSLSIWREASRREPDAENWKRNMALALKDLSGVWMDDDIPRSLDAALQARNIDQEFVNRNPTSPAALMDLAFDIGAIGRAQFLLGDYTKAAATMHENVAVREKVAAANPDDRRATDRLAYALRDLAETEMKWGQRVAARRDLLRTAQLYGRLAQNGPLNPQSLFRFAETAQDLAGASVDAPSPGVCHWVRKSLDLLEEYEKRQPVSAENAARIATMRRQAASCR